MLRFLLAKETSKLLDITDNRVELNRRPRNFSAAIDSLC